MTVTPTEPGFRGSATDGLAPQPPAMLRPATLWRRYRWPVVVVVCFVLAVGVALWTGGGDDEYGGDLDPRNTGPEGAQAVAKVLDREGVDVTIVRSADELADAEVDASTTVLVTGTESLASSTIRHLRRQAREANLVLADPPSYVIDEIDELDTRISGAVDDVAADCDDPLYDGLTLTVDTATAYEREGCFPTDEGHLLVTGRSGTVYLGAAEALTNDQVLRGDNAAVALRLLGQDGRLVWYVPSLEDTVGGEAVSLSELLPRWIGPGLWMAALALLALVLWRYRRLGPLSTEPLPVVVRAVETARSRGRMYRKGGDRAHAAAALRTAARRRLAERLALGRQASEDAVIDAVAARLDRRREDVAVRLSDSGPVPDTDARLVHLAQELSQLIREVPRG